MPGLPRELPLSPDSQPSEGRALSGNAESGSCWDHSSCGEQQRGHRKGGQARCRTGSRNHIKVTGTQARAGGDRGRVQKPRPHGATPVCSMAPGPGKGRSDGGPSRPRSGMIQRTCVPWVLEQRTWVISWWGHRWVSAPAPCSAVRSMGSGPRGPGFEPQLLQS